MAILLLQMSLLLLSSRNDSRSAFRCILETEGIINVFGNINHF